jgi:C_GCAxxG_C_C family probable redox protein
MREGNVVEMSEDEKKELLDRVEKRAAAYDYEFSGCGQMVILALQQEFKFPQGMAVFKAASFVGRATSGVGGTCGALVGGILALGMAAGRSNFEDTIWPNPQDKGETGFPKSVETVRRFYKRYAEEMGSLKCSEIQEKLLGKTYNPEDKDETLRFEHEGGREACSKCVGKAARLAAETLLQMPRR